MRFLLGALLAAELGLTQEITRPNLTTACPELAKQCGGDPSSIIPCLLQFSPDALVPGLCQDTLRAYLAAPPRTRRYDESKQSGTDNSRTSASRFHSRDRRERPDQGDRERNDSDSDDDINDSNDSRSGGRSGRPRRNNTVSAFEGRSRGDWQRDNITRREARWPNRNATPPSRDRSPKSRESRHSDRSPEARPSSPEDWSSSRIKNNATSYRRRQASWDSTPPSNRGDEGSNSRSWRRASSWRREADWNATRGSRSGPRGPPPIDGARGPSSRFGNYNSTRGERESFRERRESSSESTRRQANATRTWHRQRGDYKNLTREEHGPREHDGKLSEYRGSKDNSSRFERLAREVHNARTHDRTERHGGKADSSRAQATAQFPDVPAEVPIVPSPEVNVLNTQA